MWSSSSGRLRNRDEGRLKRKIEEPPEEIKFSKGKNLRGLRSGKNVPKKKGSTSRGNSRPPRPSPRVQAAPAYVSLFPPSRPQWPPPPKEYNIVDHTMDIRTGARFWDMVKGSGLRMNFVDQLAKESMYPEDTGDPDWLAEVVEEYVSTNPPEAYMDVPIVPTPQQPEPIVIPSIPVPVPNSKSSLPESQLHELSSTAVKRKLDPPELLPLLPKQPAPARALDVPCICMPESPEFKASISKVDQTSEPEIGQREEQELPTFEVQEPITRYESPSLLVVEKQSSAPRGKPKIQFKKSSAFRPPSPIFITTTIAQKPGVGGGGGGHTPVASILPYLCKICRTQMYSEADLQKHLVEVHNIRVFPTRIVQHAGKGGVFTNGSHVCKHCDKGFKFKIDYIAHCSLAVPLKCIFCTSEFPCLGTWTQHSLKRHLNKTKNLECIVCTATLSSRHNLVCHYATHVRNHKYDCHFCYDKLTETKSSYKTLKGMVSHLKTHDSKLVELYDGPNKPRLEIKAISRVKNENCMKENCMTFHRLPELEAI